MRIWTRLPRTGLSEGDIYFDGNSFQQKNQGKMERCKCVDLASGVLRSEPPAGKKKLKNIYFDPELGEKGKYVMTREE